MKREKAVQLVQDAIKYCLHTKPNEYTELSTFKELGADSLSVIEMSINIESSLTKEIDNSDVDKLKTVGDLISILEQKYELRP